MGGGKTTSGMPGQHDAQMSAVAAALADRPGVSYGGPGFGSGALKVGGKIFAMRSSKGAFVVKLPRPRVDELVAAGLGARFDPGKGKLMKEWFVPDGGTKAALIALAGEALAYVSGGASAGQVTAPARGATKGRPGKARSGAAKRGP